MTPQQKRAAPILQKHYAHILSGRTLTVDEITAELRILRRRKAQGLLDDFSMRLYSAIFGTPTDRNES